MASDAYWRARSAKIRRPFSRMTNAALVGAGPMFAVNGAITLGVVERYDQAPLLLKTFLPRLTALLSDEKNFNRFPEHEKLGRLADLRKQVHMAHWLLRGEFDPELSRLARDAQWRSFRFHSPSAKPDVLLLLDLMLFEIESGQPRQARKLYEKYEKSPLDVPPQSLRFSQNPRSLIYAHLRAKDISVETLHKARASFRAAATKWEKDVCPIVYVLLPEAARILSACLRLIGKASAPSNIFSLLR